MCLRRLLFAPFLVLILASPNTAGSPSEDSLYRGIGDYPGEFQNPWTLPNTTARCFNTFELLDVDVIADPVRDLHLGIRPGINSKIPPPFKLTRLVWTIEPNPNETDPNTYVFSYPPNVVESTLADDILTFQPSRRHFNFTGEAGVLIRLPQNEALTSISYCSVYTPGSDRIQILDANGFPALHHVELKTSQQYTKLLPGQGVSIKIMNDMARAPTYNGLNLEATGSGILIQAALDLVDLVRFENVVNSHLDLSFQNVQRGFEFLQGSDTLIHLDGPLTRASQRLNVTSDAYLQVYDPTGTFQCDPNGPFACSVFNNATVEVEPFPCTTLPLSDQDVLFCNTSFLFHLGIRRDLPVFDTQSGYGCTIEGMQYEPLIAPGSGVPPQANQRLMAALVMAVSVLYGTA